MRILIIVDCYYPTTKSSAKLVHDLGAEFHKRGHQVTILAPSEAVENPVEVTDEAGLRIARIKTGKIKGAGIFLRAVNEVRLSATLWKKAKPFLEQNPCNLVLFYSPSIFFGGLVRRLKSLWQCPSYLILRDIFPKWAVDAGILRKGIVHTYFRKRELEQYSAADVIAVQSPGNLAYFAEEYPDRKFRLEVLFNWTALNEAELPHSAYREKLGLTGKVVFLFGGNIGLAQDMDNIVRLASSLQDHPNLYFLLVGEGQEVERLTTLIREKGMSNMKLLPAVSQREYLAMLAEFDVGLLSLDKKLTTQNFPGKLLTYMYHSIPVLASFNPGNDVMNIFEEANAALCSINGDDVALRENALRLASDVLLRSQVGKNGRALLEEKFSASAAADKILSGIELLKKKSPRSFHATASSLRGS